MNEQQRLSCSLTQANMFRFLPPGDAMQAWWQIFQVYFDQSHCLFCSPQINPFCITLQRVGLTTVNAVPHVTEILNMILYWGGELLPASCIYSVHHLPFLHKSELPWWSRKLFLNMTGDSQCELMSDSAKLMSNSVNTVLYVVYILIHVFYMWERQNDLPSGFLFPVR